MPNERHYNNELNLESVGINQPFNMQAEQSVLGAVLLKPDTLTDLVEIIKPEMFYTRQNAQIWSEMLRLFTNDQTIDFVTLLDAVISDGVFPSADEAKVYLTGLAETVPSISNVKAYAQIVQEKYLVRQLMDVAKDILQDAGDEPDADLLLENAEQRIYEIRSGRDSSALTPLSSSMVETLTNLQKNDSKGLDIISFASVNWDVLPCLNVMAQFNYKHGEQITDKYFPKKYSESGVFNDGYGSIDNWKDDNIVFEAYATFDKTFGGKHRLTVMGGYSYENYQSRSSSLAAKGFINESLGNENLAAGDSETYSIGNSSYKTELVSALTRINYTFDNRFLFTFTARADGSSKFGSNNKWAFFPSGAFSWKMHEERFIKDLNVFDMLKIRASYGISGNQGISAYQTLSRYGQHKYFNGGKWVTAIGPGYQSGYTGQDGIYALWSGIPNKGLKWETTAQVDLGLDMSFFGNRLNVTFDWYDKRTSDLLRERNIAPSSGYDKMWVNDGEIRNRGIELTIDGVAFQNRDWRVGGTFVFSRNRNKVLSLGNAVQTGLKTDLRTGMQYEYYGNQSEQFRAYTNILAVGQPMYVFYGYKTDGIVQSLADGLSAGLSGDDAQPGEFKYVDIYDGDGMETVDENDMCIIGDPNPDWMASLGIDVSWRRFDFSIFFNGVFGNDVLNTKRFDQPSNMPMRWTADNPTNAYPRLNANRQTKLSDWWVEDGSFVRIQTMTLGYSIPFSKKDAARKVRLYISADNLYTFTGFEGYDPEVGMTGIYSGGYPRLRKWTFGADFTF